MLHRLLLAGLVALGVMTSSATAQPFSEAAVARAIGQAASLSARIRGYHHWQGLTPPPASYCATMREGEAVEKELARLASRAILYRQPGLALGPDSGEFTMMSDELDEEEGDQSQQAEIPITRFTPVRRRRRRSPSVRPCSGSSRRGRRPAGCGRTRCGCRSMRADR